MSTLGGPPGTSWDGQTSFSYLRDGVRGQRYQMPLSTKHSSGTPKHHSIACQMADLVKPLIMIQIRRALLLQNRSNIWQLKGEEFSLKRSFPAWAPCLSVGGKINPVCFRQGLPSTPEGKILVGKRMEIVKRKAWIVKERSVKPSEPEGFGSTHWVDVQWGWLLV